MYYIGQCNLNYVYLHLNCAAYLVQKKTATSRRPVPVVTDDSSESSEEEEEDVDDSDVDADFQLDRRQLEVEKV